MSISAAVLTGWAVGIPWLLALSPRFVTMKPATAIGFFLSGFSLLLLVTESSLTTVRRRLSQGPAILVALLGIATTIEFATGLTLHFDDLRAPAKPARCNE